MENSAGVRGWERRQLRRRRKGVVVLRSICFVGEGWRDILGKARGVRRRGC